MKNVLESTENRADQTEERNGKLNDRNLEKTQVKEERELRVNKNDRTLWELPDSIKKSNIRMVGIPETEGVIRKQRAYWKT